LRLIVQRRQFRRIGSASCLNCASDLPWSSGSA
jgi:hypothetical protein